MSDLKEKTITQQGMLAYYLFNHNIGKCIHILGGLKDTIYSICLRKHDAVEIGERIHIL